ncbi:MAG: hypothetical protein KME13_03795 [Myxacorys californica WJT36-NPBG1]|nr:hypothetical protein [Myxacorys californica WJT36-NPBG1]
MNQQQMSDHLPKHLYQLNQKVLIFHNDKQPWTVGKVGEIASLINEPHPWDYCGNEPYYYVFVDHSEGSSSGCVLIQSALKAVGHIDLTVETVGEE